jgi:hypothetical protein
VDIINKSVTGFALSEPCPCRATDDKQLVAIRDDRRDGSAGGYVVVTSDDGGSTWDTQNYTTANPFATDYPFFININKPFTDDLVAVIGTRDYNGSSSDGVVIEFARADALNVWNNLSVLATGSTLAGYVDPLADSVTSNGQEFGHPTYVRLSTDEELLTVWMDDADENQTPDIYRGSLIADTVSSIKETVQNENGVARRLTNVAGS